MPILPVTSTATIVNSSTGEHEKSVATTLLVHQVNMCSTEHGDGDEKEDGDVEGESNRGESNEESSKDGGEKNNDYGVQGCAGKY